MFGGREGAQRRFVAVVLSPAVIYLAVFAVLPIVWAITLAFFDFSPRRTGTPFLGLGADNPFVGLEHFKRMFDFVADGTARGPPVPHRAEGHAGVRLPGGPAEPR